MDIIPSAKQLQKALHILQKIEKLESELAGLLPEAAAVSSPVFKRMANEIRIQLGSNRLHKR